MHMARVSIIIPVYNGADYLREAIDSALCQTWKNIEIIVVNDGSRDGGATSAIARSYGERIVYVEKSNGGVATALNEGIRRMTGEYFSWLSHDDLYLPGKVAHQMQLIRQCDNPHQLVAGGYYIVNERRHPIGIMDFRRLYPPDRLETPIFPVVHCAVNGCTLMRHRSHFDRVGLFNEALQTTQDYDLWFRMLRGRRLMYTRAIDVVSRAHSGQTSQKLAGIHEQECTRLWLDMFESLTAEERVQMAGDEATFYGELAHHFASYTSYANVAAWLKDRQTGSPRTITFRRETTRMEQCLQALQLKALRLLL